LEQGGLALICNVARVMDACKTHGVSLGTHVIQPDAEKVIECYRQGYRLIAFSLDITMLMKTCHDGLKEIRGRLS